MKTIVGFFISGLLADWVGWEAVFYIEGCACFVWLALWLWLASDTPQTHPSISEAERDYILAGLPATNPEPLPIPWKSIWTSLPFWAIMFSNFGNNWGFHLLMTELPLYLSKNFADMKTIVGFFISGILADWVGWEAVFYIEGCACFVWLALWLWLASDTPQTHPSISEAERD